jgi:hypothetical protein
MKEHLILEKLNPEDVNLDSFEIKPKLNPKLWATENKIRPEVRKQLLKIADDFFESLDIPWVEIKDVRLTGSLANYNWSKFSDVDLHVIIDYKDVNDDVDLVKEYLKLKKDSWNDLHDLTVNDYDVELYAQDYKEPHVASGVYSLEDNEWIKKPKKQKPKYDKEVVKQKAADIIDEIDEIEDLFKAEKYDDVMKAYQPLWDKIKDMRKKGLTHSGEYSIENIVFKVLRRGEYLERLTDLKNRAYDSINSITVMDESLYLLNK